MSQKRGAAATERRTERTADSRDCPRDLGCDRARTTGAARDPASLPGREATRQNWHHTPATASVPWHDASEGFDWELNQDRAAGGNGLWIDLLQIEEGLDISTGLGEPLYQVDRVPSPVAALWQRSTVIGLPNTKRRHQTHHASRELHQAS